MALGIETFASGLDTDETHASVGHESAEHSHRVRSATDTRYDGRWQSADACQHLLARLTPYDALKVTNHARIRGRPDDGADDVVRRVDVRYPVTNRLAR